MAILTSCCMRCCYLLEFDMIRWSIRNLLRLFVICSIVYFDKRPHCRADCGQGSTHIQTEKPTDRLLV